MKFSGEKNGEASGAFPGSGEEWRIKFDANGVCDVKDEAIAAALVRASEHPDSPIQVKG